MRKELINLTLVRQTKLVLNADIVLAEVAADSGVVVLDDGDE